jgi:hypothetical protein
LVSVIEEIKRKGLSNPVQSKYFLYGYLNDQDWRRIWRWIALSKCRLLRTRSGSRSSTGNNVEPIVMIIMAGVVGFIVLSILYPMLSIYDTMSAR